MFWDIARMSDMADEKKTETCWTCKFNVGNGCHRYPPQLMKYIIDSECKWPYVVRDDWCGEYKEKKDNE